MRTRRNAQPGLGLVVLSWLAGVVSANEQFTSTPANFRGFQLYANGASKFGSGRCTSKILTVPAS